MEQGHCEMSSGEDHGYRRIVQHLAGGPAKKRLVGTWVTRAAHDHRFRAGDGRMAFQDVRNSRTATRKDVDLDPDTMSGQEQRQISAGIRSVPMPNVGINHEYIDEASTS